MFAWVTTLNEIQGRLKPTATSMASPSKKPSRCLVTLCRWTCLIPITRNPSSVIGRRGYLLDSSSEPETRDNGSRAGAAGTASRRAAPRTSLAHSCHSQTPRGALWTGVPSTD